LEGVNVAGDFLKPYDRGGTAAIPSGDDDKLCLYLRPVAAGHCRRCRHGKPTGGRHPGFCRHDRGICLGTFLIPMLYVVFQQMRERVGRPRPESMEETPDNTGSDTS
jgi:hypothetical protein